MVGRSTPLLPGGGTKPGAAMRQRGRRLRSNLVGERGVCVLLLLGIAALTSSAAMSYFLPHLLAWRRASRCLPTVGALQPCPPEASHPRLDVVAVAAKPTCVTRLAVLALNQYIGPRRIVFVSSTSAACDRLTSFASNVECVPEDDLIPGVTKAAVNTELARLYGIGRPRKAKVNGGEQGGDYMGRSHGGWYLQQLVKLGASRYLPGLSDTFMVWDPDMIPLWPVTVFGERSATNGGKRKVFRQVGGYVIRSYEKSYETLTNERIQYAPDGSSYVTHQMVMEKAYVEELLGAFAETWERKLSLTSAVMASKLAPVAGGASIDDKNDERQPSLESIDEDDVVNGVDDGEDTTGGWRDADDFVRRKMNRRRRGLTMFEAWPEDKGSGKMKRRNSADPRRAGAFAKEVPEGLPEGVAEVGAELGAEANTAVHINAVPRPMPAWAAAVLASLPPDKLTLGFSEYAAYASWVAAKHPESVELAPTRRWSRHPLGPVIGSLGVRAQRMLNGNGLCCPGAGVVKWMKLFGYQYAGFEIGHVPSCGLDLPRHRDSYGL